MKPYRILVTGSRDWTDADTIDLNLIGATGRLDCLRGVVVVDGQCTKGGADQLAHEAAKRRGWGTERYPADWNQHGKAAGSIRNQEMIALGADLVLAFPLPGSVGTWDCIRRASAAGIRVVIVPAVLSKTETTP